MGSPPVPVLVVPGRAVRPGEVSAGLTVRAPPPPQPQSVSPAQLPDELVLPAAVDGGQIPLLCPALSPGLPPGPRLLDELVAETSVLGVAGGTAGIETDRPLLTRTPTLPSRLILNIKY